MTSRAKVAEYVADHMEADRSGALAAAASWLIDHRATRQARYLAQDVARVWADRGYVYAQVTTARPLSAAARAEIEAFIKHHTQARELELVTTVDPGVIGGARIEMPGAELDGTVKVKLAKFVERVERYYE
jgi:F0F1-type ATP synthase delta subunit